MNVDRAVSVVLISSLVVVIGMLALLTTELGQTSVSISRGKFLELLFEVVSAFGTVGLSMGATSGLTVAGKFIITLIMFVGRLGPLLIAVAISREVSSKSYYAEESIMIG
jgi:trk system potassium uptake protein TrkH